MASVFGGSPVAEEASRTTTTGSGEAGGFKGVIATGLGVANNGPTILDQDNLITQAFVDKQGPDLVKTFDAQSKKLQEMKDKETDKTEVEAFEEKMRETEASLAIKAAWDPKVFDHLRPYDEECLAQIGGREALETYKANALISGETLDAAIDVVAFKGFVGHGDDLKVGRGLLLLTSLGDKHRIHFYHADHDSSFDASMAYRMSKDLTEGAELFKKGEQATAKKATAKIKAEHKLSGTFRAMYVENNLLHVHSEVEQVSKYVSSTWATSWAVEEVPAICCEAEVPKCCVMCLNCLCCRCPKMCPSCGDCFKLCMGCCAAMPFMPSFSDASWTGSVKSEKDKKAALEMLLVKPWEVSEQGVDVMLPLEVMDREGSIPNGIAEKAGSSRSAPTIHMTMRNSATNKIESGLVIVDPSTAMPEIIKFVSTIQIYSENSSIDMKDPMISWSSMGLKKEDPSLMAPSTSGGMSGVASATPTIPSMASMPLISCCKK